jgi:drug/metabolite transporter (DMT)-like permease
MGGGQLWFGLTILEGVLMGIAKLFHGLVGSQSPTMHHVVFAVAIVGAVQALVGFGGAVVVRERLFRVHGAYILGFTVFGLLALVATLFAFLAFRTGARADMATNTFIVSVLAIVPAAVIGRFGFKEHIGWNQLAGGLLAIAGGALLLSPSLTGGTIPVWVWWSCITMLGATGTHTAAKLLSRFVQRNKVPKISMTANIFVLQFWGGITMAGCALFLLAIDGATLLWDPWRVPKLWTYAACVALTNLGWWSCRQISFQHGAPLYFRMLPWLGCYLGTATLSGMVVFHETLPLTKSIGLLVFLPAIVLYQRELWGYCARPVQRWLAAGKELA